MRLISDCIFLFVHSFKKSTFDIIRLFIFSGIIILYRDIEMRCILSLGNKNSKNGKCKTFERANELYMKRYLLDFN